ncbi:hypothetical protein [secondary endosymbiont of Heteropsylla cubana]|nr:hypothetical protein [secondary endosymbiont of Heteropsylla cubana]
MEIVVDIELLKTFLAVGRARYFLGAAEAIYSIQSVVSFLIRHLEQKK